MRKALLLSNTALASNGGIQTYRRYLTNCLLKNGYIVDFVYRDLKSEEKIKNLNYFNIERKYNLPKIFNIIYTAYYLAKTKYDIVLISHINYIVLAPILKLLLKKNIVLFVYGIDVKDLSYIRKKSCNFVDLVISHSNFTKLNFLKNYDFFKKFIVPIGGPFEEKKKVKIKSKNKLVNITSVTRIEKADSYKNIHEIIKSLVILKKKKINFVYNLVGDGDDLENIKKQIKRFKLDKNVIVHGWVSENKKEQILMQTDFYLLPSDGEGFGLSFIEAASYGATVLGSISDGSREALLFGKFGFLIDPKDKEISSKIADIIVNNRKIKVNQKELNEKYSFKIFNEKIIFCLNKLNNETIDIFRFDNKKNRIQSINNVAEGLATTLYWKTKYNVNFEYQRTNKNNFINIYSKYIFTFIVVLLSNFKKRKITIFSDQGLSIYKLLFFKKSLLFCHDVLNLLIIKNIIKVNFEIKNKFIYRLILYALNKNSIIYSSLTTKKNLKDLNIVNNKIIKLLYPIYHLLHEDNIIAGNILSDKYNFRENKHSILIISSNTWYKRDDQLYDIIRSIKNNNVIFNIISLNRTQDISKIEKIKNVKVWYSVSDFDKNYILSKSNFLVYNSDFEGFGLPILESLKYSSVVFCKEKEHFKQIYKDGIIYYNSNNIKMINDKINLILKNKKIFEFYKKKSLKTYSDVKLKFNKGFYELIKERIN